MNDVYLLLGSNLGDRHLFLQKAIAGIEQEVGPVFKASAVYETQSWGKTDSPDYLNQVVMVKTDEPALSVLKKILAIELGLGRRREEKWGSRTIDIDILLYADDLISEPGLTIPHPEFHKRRFTLEPLSEIAPALIPPGFTSTILQLKKDLQDSLIVKKL